MGEYDDIIDPSISKRHSSMPVADRAAQFAALTGYGGTIGEAARLMDERAELGADDRRELNEKLRLLIASAEHHPEQSVTYFETVAKRQAAGTLSGEYRPRIDAAVRTAHPYCCERSHTLSRIRSNRAFNSVLHQILDCGGAEGIVYRAVELCLRGKRLAEFRSLAGGVAARVMATGARRPR